ncbi:hypothetical protein ASPACDRAFT_47821 [Aspergillus aculeatus ATCC 16872]|uniref:Nucleotidyl transferase AbiEii/AbiGii toxin family protein n=1 Tax=Aspergillus aculeatus (strain ATCC 16872 / CBS 172.66 / WB 5094) TaxID=690307 RepID=A0A1L9WH26_ASPA1|nr:uncharacterized protein ASPACDRAFT_47821 [Aspergillus aculeatus ATCC 16872]OJJ95466.1 hypothetical protein ASPACDRAFT_47821 [Aspergillus aculeatus ATCC 16872]
MEKVTRTIKNVLTHLQDENIPAAVIGEIALNYYNVPRVVHDIEICVPGSLLSDAVSTLCLTKQYTVKEKQEYDIFTEYKRGFPVLEATYSKMTIVIFSDAHFHLSPLEHNLVPCDGGPLTSYSREILDVVPVDEMQHFPVPCLRPYVIGLCRRYFENHDAMARIAAEQLVDGMNLDEEWIRTNLREAPLKARELMIMLMAEKSSRMDNEFLDVITPDPVVENGLEGLRLIPGSGY